MPCTRTQTHIITSAFNQFVQDVLNKHDGGLVLNENHFQCQIKMTERIPSVSNSSVSTLEIIFLVFFYLN